jgi:hypothetical protein
LILRVFVGIVQLIGVFLKVKEIPISNGLVAVCVFVALEAVAVKERQGVMLTSNAKMTGTVL